MGLITRRVFLEKMEKKKKKKEMAGNGTNERSFRDQRCIIFFFLSPLPIEHLLDGWSREDTRDFMN